MADEEAVEVSLFDNDEQPAEQAGSVEAAAPEETKEASSFEIPDKFKGKQLEDVIESYVNLEKEYGSKASEVGELRKLTDQILQNQVASQSATAQADPNVGHGNEIGFDDFIEQPEVAIDKALERNPRLQRLEESLAQRDHEIARQALLSRHEDADQVVQSPEFLKWVQESPGRQRMLQDAHIHNDAAVASDLIDVFKTTKQVAREEAVTERGAKATSDLKKATTETGSVPAKTKKIFKRTELIHLKVTDPRRYEAMQDEIHAAYAEGRVK